MWAPARGQSSCLQVARPKVPLNLLPSPLPMCVVGQMAQNLPAQQSEEPGGHFFTPTCHPFPGPAHLNRWRHSDPALLSLCTFLVFIPVGPPSGPSIISVISCVPGQFSLFHSPLRLLHNFLTCSDWPLHVLIRQPHFPPQENRDHQVA